MTSCLCNGNKNFSSFINSFLFRRLKYEFMLAQRNCYWLISQQKPKTPIASYLNVNHCVIRYNRNEKCDLNKMEKEKDAIEMQAHICRPSREERREGVNERASQCHSKQTCISSGESKPPFCMQIKQSVNNKETPFPALCFVTTLCVRSRSQTAFVCPFWQFVGIITNTNTPNRHEYTIETKPNRMVCMMIGAFVSTKNETKTGMEHRETMRCDAMKVIIGTSPKHKQKLWNQSINYLFEMITKVSHISTTTDERDSFI